VGGIAGVFTCASVERMIFVKLVMTVLTRLIDFGGLEIKFG